MDLVDVIHAILIQRGEAMHLLPITQECVVLGLVPDESKESQRIIYGVLVNDINRYGDNSRFRRGGRAQFVASEQYDPSKHVVKPNTTKKSEDRKYERKVAGVAEADRRCGNCRFIAWSGPGYLHQAGGGCSNQEKSGLWYVRADQMPCPHWRQRSADQLAADRREREVDQIAITKVNLTLRGKKR